MEGNVADSIKSHSNEDSMENVHKHKYFGGNITHKFVRNIYVKFVVSKCHCRVIAFEFIC